MKKDMYAYYGVPEPKQVDVPDVQEPVENSDSTRAILEAIYALDPVTKLPTGDIMCYMASTTPLEIKQYVMANIMVDTSSQQLPPLPDGLDEDTAFALQRGSKENVDAYRSRINAFMQQQVNIRNMAIENAKRQTFGEPAE